MSLSTPQIILICYFAGMTLAGFISMGADKLRAIRHEWRISERTLFVIALLGGSLGSLLGMLIFRHKTRHWRFLLFIPLLFLAQLAILYAVWSRL